MKDKMLSKNAMKICMKDSVDKIMEIFEKEDGRSYEEKKEDVIRYLKEQEDKLFAKRLLSFSNDNKDNKGIKEKFWESVEIFYAGNNVVLRMVKDTDKEKYLELQQETSLMKSMLKKESYRNLLWDEHVDLNALMCAIDVNGEYIGYCGIKNITQKKWEIAIEMFKKWTHQGLGYTAISCMLNEIKKRLGVFEFRVRIDPGNLASQKLFEKLGAVPNGISEFMLHNEDDLAQCEEENLHYIDETIVALAEKFDVEPRKLLSHVLEYKLLWK